MKQKEIAEELGISKSYVSMILSGQRKANPKVMARLCSQGLVNFERGASLRGRCPKPLDECATAKSSQLSYWRSLSYPVHKGQVQEVLKAIIIL